MASPAIQQNSSDSTFITNARLSPAQNQAVAAMAQGKSVTSAAAAAGVHRTTIHHWLRTSEDFSAAVKRAKSDFAAFLADELRDLSAAAFETLRKLLADPETPPAVRLKAALAVLERPHFPDPGWQLPAPVLTPREQEVLADLAQIRAEYNGMRMTDALQRREEAAQAP